jgi:hypothetical protein
MIEAGSVILGCVFFAVGEYFIVGYEIDVIKLLRYGSFLNYFSNCPYFLYISR